MVVELAIVIQLAHCLSLATFITVSVNVSQNLEVVDATNVNPTSGETQGSNVSTVTATFKALLKNNVTMRQENVFVWKVCN